MSEHPTQTEQTRLELFRYSLLGFSWTMVTSPLAVYVAQQTLERHYHYSSRSVPEEVFLLLCYPAFGTLVSALLLALSRRRLSVALIILAIPSMLFGTLAVGLQTRNEPCLIVCGLLFLSALPILNEILRNAAKEQGHLLSARLFLVQHAVAVGSFAILAAQLTQILVPIFLFFLWFSYPLCYLALWFESRNGPQYWNTDSLPGGDSAAVQLG